METSEERWEYRWQKINRHLAGDIFSSVFKLAQFDTDTPNKTLQLLKDLAFKNCCENADKDRYKDLLLYITTSMALHSPYGKDLKNKSAEQVELRG